MQAAFLYDACNTHTNIKQHVHTYMQKPHHLNAVSPYIINCVKIQCKIVQLPFKHVY